MEGTMTRISNKIKVMHHNGAIKLSNLNGTAKVLKEESQPTPTPTPTPTGS
jgi:hypothetical protein